MDREIIEFFRSVYTTKNDGIIREIIFQLSINNDYSYNINEITRNN